MSDQELDDTAKSMRFAFIDGAKAQFPVRLRCRHWVAVLQPL